jgi:hypothetical protein
MQELEITSTSSGLAATQILLEMLVKANQALIDPTLCKYLVQTEIFLPVTLGSEATLRCLIVLG